MNILRIFKYINLSKEIFELKGMLKRLFMENDGIENMEDDRYIVIVNHAHLIYNTNISISKKKPHKQITGVIKMLRKSINLLKSNPLLVVYFLGYEFMGFLVLYLLYPKNLGVYNHGDVMDLVSMMIFMMKMLLSSILMFFLSILFMSGFGHMTAEAVMNGKLASSSFMIGLKKYFVRILLMSLLVFAMVIGVAILFSFVTVPIILFQSFSGQEDNIYVLSMAMSIIITVIIIALIPFIILWLPAIFIDNVRTIQGLKSGVKAGRKNYLKLLGLLFFVYLPIVAYQIFNYPSLMNGDIFTPTYIGVLIIETCIALVIFPAFFFLYYDYRTKNSKMN